MISKGEGITGDNKALVGVLIALCSVMVLLIGGIVVVKINQNDDVEPELVYEEEDVELTPKSSLEEYMNETNEQLNNAATNEEKAIIYTDRAAELLDRHLDGEGDYSEQILADAYKAEELDPSGDTAYAIYMYERELGSKKKANEYLKIAEERGHVAGGMG